jgi:hypothetical protein
MTAKYNQKKRLLTVICKMALATRDVTMTPSINVLKESMATDCGKMCIYVLTGGNFCRRGLMRWPAKGERRKPRDCQSHLRDRKGR